MPKGEVVYFDHEGTDCKDRYHRRCTGRWRCELNLGKDGQGKRRRRKVSAKTKAELYEKLDELRDELDQGVRSSRTYTVAQAVDDWLAGPMADRAAKTISTQRETLDPLTEILGEIVLRDLTADDVSKALIKIAATRSTRTVRDTRASLVRVITYAQARGLVSRNVAALIKAPQGQAPGRPSKALTVAQALAVLKAAEADRLNAYFVLSLLTGVRTEEARALRWDHVDPAQLCRWARGARGCRDLGGVHARRRALPELARTGKRAPGVSTIRGRAAMFRPEFSGSKLLDHAADDAAHHLVVHRRDRVEVRLGQAPLGDHGLGYGERGLGCWGWPRFGIWTLEWSLAAGVDPGRSRRVVGREQCQVLPVVLGMKGTELLGGQ